MKKKSTALRLRGVTKSFAGLTALDSLDLDVKPGELVALLGPSGCGKTTALRIVAGLEKADSGSVMVRGENITELPAHKRHMGMVFQQYSLFPNLTAEENAAFGLRMQGVGGPERKAKALELLELVGLSALAKRYPHEMSGGQQQRVALARALAVEPEVLLLDEPLSALDAKVRTSLREEIRRLQLELGTTTIFVTHDQEEAMAISDRVAVMSRGKIEQIDTPDVLYSTPASSFVASFVGNMNRIPAEFDGKHAHLLGGKAKVSNTDSTVAASVVALVRPENIRLFKPAHNAKAVADATVINRSFLGPVSQVTARTVDGHVVSALLPTADTGDLHAGDAVAIELLAKQIMIEGSNV